ncbi:MAG: hypothetical protein J3R72DRAFT_442198 [Linnemannia gamsii]|nr:MAG: hypothetical protein J3R72DRAFT_442198 [Linnemannia gamsii]
MLVSLLLYPSHPAPLLHPISPFKPPPKVFLKPTKPLNKGKHHTFTQTYSPYTNKQRKREPIEMPIRNCPATPPSYSLLCFALLCFALLCSIGSPRFSCFSRCLALNLSPTKKDTMKEREKAGVLHKSFFAGGIVVPKSWLVSSASLLLFYRPLHILTRLSSFIVLSKHHSCQFTRNTACKKKENGPIQYILIRFTALSFLGKHTKKKRRE